MFLSGGERFVLATRQTKIHIFGPGDRGPFPKSGWLAGDLRKKSFDPFFFQKTGFLLDFSIK